MKTILAAMAIMGALAAGCQEAGTRPWESRPLSTHDRQRAFDAALAVVEQHFEVAQANYTEGTIETKPQQASEKRITTLADLRGAGGRWRQIVTVQIDRDGLDIIGRAVVRLEQEATQQAVAASETRGSYSASDSEVPRAAVVQTNADTNYGHEVWVQVGYDQSLARELLNEIAAKVEQEEGGEAVPPGEALQDVEQEGMRAGQEKRP